MAQPSQDKIDNEIVVEDWYEVEFIIFKHLAPLAETQPELWSNNLHLSYPVNWVVLQDRRLTEEIDFRTITLQTPNNNLTNEQQFPLNQELTNSLPSQTNSTDSVSDPNTPDTERLTKNDFINKVFESYAFFYEDKKGLEQQGRRLRNGRNFTVIQQRKWLQPIKDKDSSPSILLEAGEKFGEFYEFSGSFKIYKGRYLHINTDIWQLSYEPNLSLEYQYSPILLPKNPSIKNQINSSESFSNRKNVFNNLNFRNSDNNNYGLPAVGWYSFSKENPYEDAPYIPVSAKILNESRRMRSGELHYLDHPEFGLLIRISPVDIIELASKGELKTEEFLLN